MPILNLKDSVISEESFDIVSVKEKFKGPTIVYQSTPIPIELLILLDPFNEES